MCLLLNRHGFSATDVNRAKIVFSAAIRGFKRIDEQEYLYLYLLFGNLHEHTNFSHCWPDGSDGDCDENYQHGIDVEGYDFVVLTESRI